MRGSRVLFAAGALVAGLTLAAGVAPAGAAAEKSPLRDLLSLQGEWEGKNLEGKTARATYQVVEGGTAVVETLKLAEHDAMVTVYHADGDRVMLTHYSMVGNQPRMRSGAPAGRGTLRFEFVDATNLPGPGAGHMHNLLLTFTGPDRLRQAWTWKEGSNEKTEVIELSRRSGAPPGAEGSGSLLQRHLEEFLPAGPLDLPLADLEPLA